MAFDSDDNGLLYSLSVLCPFSAIFTVCSLPYLGLLGPSEIYGALRYLEMPDLTPDDVLDFLEAGDTNRDGMLDFKE